jgi:hypothetical protein
MHWTLLSPPLEHHVVRKGTKDEAKQLGSTFVTCAVNGGDVCSMQYAVCSMQYAVCSMQYEQCEMHIVRIIDSEQQGQREAVQTAAAGTNRYKQQQQQRQQVQTTSTQTAADSRYKQQQYIKQQYKQQ